MAMWEKQYPLHHKISAGSKEQYSKYKKPACNQPGELIPYRLCWQINIKFSKFFVLHKNVTYPNISFFKNFFLLFHPGYFAI